jgi:hypothetical protein
VRAGKFAAGAGTPADQRRQVHLGLVGLGSTALAFAPQRLVIGTQQAPFAIDGQAAAGLGRRRIRREREYLLARESYFHMRTHFRSTHHSEGG